MKKDVKKQICFVVIIMGIISLAGCTQTFSGKKPSGSQTGSAAASVTEPVPEPRKTTAVYYDFEDVLIPLDLKIIQDKSMIVSTPGFTSGIVMLKGRVDRRSLINFFNNNMQKDNWTMVSQISSPNIAILVFEKPLKSAVISIKSEQIYTYVEVGVAARINQGALPGDMGTMSDSNLFE
jgi:hypothetical protein